MDGMLLQHCHVQSLYDALLWLKDMSCSFVSVVSSVDVAFIQSRACMQGVSSVRYLQSVHVAAEALQIVHAAMLWPAD